MTTLSVLLRALILATAVSAAAAHTFASRVAIDFSHAGYGGGGIPLPSVPAVLAVEPTGQDDTELIQAALDHLATLPLDQHGFHGALVLRPGAYRVDGQLHLRSSGVVLRGDSATLIATGNSRRTLITARGQNTSNTGAGIAIADETIPAGSTRITLVSVDGLTVGSRVAIRRPSTKEWIAALGMDQFTGSFKNARLDWLPGSRDVEWSRTLVSIDAVNRTISIDAPLTCSLEKKDGGGTVHIESHTNRLARIGIEGLQCKSAFDATHPHDEEHAWICISLDDVENAWVRNITAEHFVSAAVWLGAGTRAITVQDCQSRSPVGENGGWRRFGFYAGGQQILVQRCIAEGAREAFAGGLCAAGPNVFLECVAKNSTGDSGSFESWSTGLLFDRVRIEGAGIFLGNLASRYQGAGWNAANGVVWNSEAPRLVADSPPGEQNLNITDTATPSLYRAQLSARLGEQALAALSGQNLPSTNREATPFKAPVPAQSKSSVSAELSVSNGCFVLGGKTVFGTGSSNAWWKGQTVPTRARELGWHPTRWAPGLDGPGLTEDLTELAQHLAARDQLLVQVWPGLWYDRRRDDHKTDMRPDSEVWAPFYEQPWARSGQGTASDGLSNYDLTQFNPWYWNRLRELARVCAGNGQILYHHFYNHHNLIEAAAHWADSPWRPANCLQETGFPEPPPYENGGKRINIVADFYDVTHPVRRELHQKFIWHGLDALSDQPNVVHTLAFQFAGPLSFQKFFLDTVRDWEKARGKKALLVLSTSKAITDVILDDPERATLISAIDMRYWQYLADGTLFAPHTDGNTAFREDRVKAFGKDVVPPSSPGFVYKQVREYHDRFPSKAIICPHAGQGPIPVLLAGGAIPLLADYAAAQPLKIERDDSVFFKFVREHLLGALPSMHPADHIATNAWCLTDGGNRHLFYAESGEAIVLNQPSAKATVWWFEANTGTTKRTDIPDGTARIAKPDTGPWLAFIVVNEKKP